jgi:histidyl-tRNA synthetase
MGGKSAPAIGFGLGIERLLLLVQELNLPVPTGVAEAYAVLPSAATVTRALPFIEKLRAGGMSVFMHAGGGSMKTQLQKADAGGATFALIFGDEGAGANVVKVKKLRDRDAAQLETGLDDAGAASILKLREAARPA